MTCAPCITAATNPRHVQFTHGCRECQARSIAGSPAAWKALPHNGRPPETAADLQHAIERVFGVEGYAEGRRMVWAWIQRLREAGP